MRSGNELESILETRDVIIEFACKSYKNKGKMQWQLVDGMVESRLKDSRPGISMFQRREIGSIPDRSNDHLASRLFGIKKMC